MRPAFFGFGIVLLVIGLVLMPIFYPLVLVDSPEDAERKAREDEFATGLELRFKGKVKEVFEDWLGTDRQVITIHGLRNIGIVTANESYSGGDEVLVEGKFYGVFGAGLVAGDKNNETGKYEPAKIERVPTLLFWLAVILLILGIAFTVAGYVKI
jgi:hypothetical protein